MTVATRVTQLVMLDDGELIDRATRGDDGAYGELVRRFRGDAVALATRITGDPAEAEEVAQEAFIKALRALPTFRSGAPFRPWLLRIVANEARDHRRARGRRERIAEALSVGLDELVETPELSALANLEAERLLVALRQLREADRLVITYRYLLDLSERETAEALAVPTGTVKSRLFRAIERLRGALEPATGHASFQAHQRAIAEARAMSYLAMPR